MMFNPCSPCCAFNIVGNNAGLLRDLYIDAGLAVRSYASLSTVDYNANLMFISDESIQFATAPNLLALKNWFLSGGKRIVFVTWGRTGTFVNMAPLHNALNSFMASTGAGLSISPGAVLQSGTGCVGATFNPHYLTQGLSGFNHSNQIYVCACYDVLFGGDLVSGTASIGSAGTGTMLTDYLGGHSIAVEKVGSSELVVFGDVLGINAYNVYPYFNDACVDNITSPPRFEPSCAPGTGFTLGCCFMTPQFLLNLATMGVQ